MPDCNNPDRNTDTRKQQKKSYECRCRISLLHTHKHTHVNNVLLILSVISPKGATTLHGKLMDDDTQKAAYSLTDTNTEASGKLHKPTTPPERRDTGTPGTVLTLRTLSNPSRSSAAGRLRRLRPARKSADASHSSLQRTESTELSFVAAVLRRCGHASQSCVGGGVDFMHQHDSATPECGATTANNG